MILRMFKYWNAAAMICIIISSSACGVGTIDLDIQDTPNSSQPETVSTINPELERELSTIEPGETIAVLAVFGNQVSIKEREKQENLIDLLKSSGAKNIVPIWIINGFSFEGDKDTIISLSKRGDVSNIRLDSVIPLAAAVPAKAPAVREWNLLAIRAEDMWAAGFTGQGVVVANMDTGVDVMHPDLAQNWRGGTNSWYDPYGEHSTPYDKNGHGTQSMGVISGGNTGATPIGVAPGAKWIAVKIYNDAGFATLSNIHLGFQWLLDPDGNPATDDAPDVVNNSWGFTQFSGECVPEFEPDIQALTAAGIGVIVSAGNDGPNSSTDLSPANYPSSISVGTIDELFEVTPFSSRGPSACDGSIYPNVVAPGSNVLTADLTFGGVFPNSYTYVSGSSFASSHLAGVWALILSARPDLTSLAIEAAIKDSAIDLFPNGPDNMSGNGLIDAMEALNLIEGNVVCDDLDGDGYFYAAGCNTPRDCDDENAAIHPDAADIKHNGVDEDCNGYDLTIEASAAYAWRRGNMRVEATSMLGKNAWLELTGYGPMRWDENRKKWSISVSVVGAQPETVNIMGVEGETAASVSRTRGSFPVPAAPSGASVQSSGASKATLNWNDASIDEAGFLIERATNISGPFSIVGTAGKNTTSYVDVGLRPGLAYFYQVRAFNSGGYSAASNTASMLAK